MSNETATKNHISAKPAGYWFESMPLTSAHWVAGLVIFVTFAIEAWEMLILIFSSQSIAAEFNLDASQIGTLISAIFLGMIPGSLIWGKLASTIGRKRCLIYSIGMYFIFPLLSANANSFEALWTIRFFAGVVLVGALVVSFPLFMELLPVAVRGRATVLLSAGWPIGTLIAVAITYFFADQGWRFVLGLSAMSSLWAILIWRCVPESAYWLGESGEADRAANVISKLSNGNICAVVRPSDEAEPNMPFFSIFKGSILRITILSTIINFCFAWGYWGMTTWLPPLLAERGLSTEQGLEFIALSTLFMFPGYISASYLTGKIGRKKVMVGYVAAATVAGIGFGLSSTVNELYVWNFTLSFFSLGAWGVWNTWAGEVYSTAARGPGVAWGVMLQRVANTIAPIVIGIVFASSGFGPTIIFISCFLGATFVSALMLPETEGERLN